MCHLIIVDGRILDDGHDEDDENNSEQCLNHESSPLWLRHEDDVEPSASVVDDGRWNIPLWTTPPPS